LPYSHAYTTPVSPSNVMQHVVQHAHFYPHRHRFCCYGPAASFTRFVACMHDEGLPLCDGQPAAAKGLVNDILAACGQARERGMDSEALRALWLRTSLTASQPEFALQLSLELSRQDLYYPPSRPRPAYCLFTALPPNCLPFSPAAAPASPPASPPVHLPVYISSCPLPTYLHAPCSPACQSANLPL